MTIADAITQSDRTNRNPYSVADKIIWLSRAEALIKKQIIDTHEGCGIPFHGFTEDTDMDTELIMPEPYDDGYIHWLQAQVHYANEDIERYNNSMTMFNRVFDKFSGYYKRTHLPKGQGRFRF